MRAVELGKVAARAEGLRLRQFANRAATRAAFGAIAVVFLIGALIAGHVAAAIAIARQLGAVDAALIVAGGDLTAAVVFGLIAGLKGPGRIEREALELRRSAQASMMELVTVSAVVAPLVRRALGRRAMEMAFGALRRGGDKSNMAKKR